MFDFAPNEPPRKPPFPSLDQLTDAAVRQIEARSGAILNAKHRAVVRRAVAERYDDLKREHGG